MPLPPYIERPSDEEDKDMYQTVYRQPGGLRGRCADGRPSLYRRAAPEKLQPKGALRLAYVTLTCRRIGTFRPVKVGEHRKSIISHFEEYSVSEETARISQRIPIAKGGRVIMAVGNYVMQDRWRARRSSMTKRRTAMCSRAGERQHRDIHISGVRVQAGRRPDNQLSPAQVHSC